MCIDLYPECLAPGKSEKRKKLHCNYCTTNLFPLDLLDLNLEFLGKGAHTHPPIKKT